MLKRLSAKELATSGVVLFIILTTAVLLLLTENGLEFIISKYALILMMLAFLAGRHLGRMEARKQKD